MNWRQKARRDYPKAWTECQNAGLLNGRDLYDHFDALGIVITIDWEDNFEATGWLYRIDRTTFSWYGNNRTEAEAGAFTHAFHIRESQLP